MKGVEERGSTAELDSLQDKRSGVGRKGASVSLEPLGGSLGVRGKGRTSRSRGVCSPYWALRGAGVQLLFARWLDSFIQPERSACSLPGTPLAQGRSTEQESDGPAPGN